MNFFKKLFSAPREEKPMEGNTPIKGVYNEEYRKNRYVEHPPGENAGIIDGSLKMVESYFLDNKIERIVADPVNHPVNLDQVIEDGMGFQMYCKAFQMEDGMVLMSLAFAFSEYMIAAYGFKLFKDNEPEFPMRSMTLQYDKNGLVLSLYPLEYSLKVLNNQSSFAELNDKIKKHLENMPDGDEIIKKMMDDEEGDS